MKLVNILAEPGAGKSATTGGVYNQLSVNGFRAEIIREVAKSFAWESPKSPTGETILHPVFAKGQQIYLLGEQNREIERVNGLVDVAVVECPLIMTAIYAPPQYFKAFEPLVLEQFNSYDNFNILLKRNHPYDVAGRLQNENESQEVRQKLIGFLDKYNIPHIIMETHDEIDREITQLIQKLCFPEKKLKSYIYKSPTPNLEKLKIK